MMGPDQLLKFLNVIAGPPGHFQQCSSWSAGWRFNFLSPNLMQREGVRGYCRALVCLIARETAHLMLPLMTRETVSFVPLTYDQMFYLLKECLITGHVSLSFLINR